MWKKKGRGVGVVGCLVPLASSPHSFPDYTKANKYLDSNTGTPFRTRRMMMMRKAIIIELLSLSLSLSSHMKE
jgi:hypothetical protein